MAVQHPWVTALFAQGWQAPLLARVPLLLGETVIGSVSADFLDSMLRMRPELGGLLQPCALEGAPAWRVQGDASLALNRIAQVLRAAGVAQVAHLWRDEQLAVKAPDGSVLATVERGAARVLGIATHSVHLIGCSPEGAFWVQQRSLAKATDPGLWDTLMGGMVPASDSVAQALERETWEEAGLRLEQLQDLQHAGDMEMRKPNGTDGGVGYIVERVDCYTCVVPDGVRPLNQDGEVARFACLTVAQLRSLLLANQFTVESALLLVRIPAVLDGWDAATDQDATLWS